MARICSIVFSSVLAAGVAERTDTEITTLLFQLTSAVKDADKAKQFRRLLVENPEYMSFQSADGRGALWWAHEFDNMEQVAFMNAVNGEQFNEMMSKRDEKGSKPQEMCKTVGCAPTADQHAKAKVLFAEVKKEIEAEYAEMEKDWVDDDEF